MDELVPYEEANLPRPNRRKNKQPITVDLVSKRVEEGAEKVSKLLRLVVGSAAIILASIGALVVLVQDQIDSLRTGDEQIQEESELLRQRAAELERELSLTQTNTEVNRQVLEEKLDTTSEQAESARAQAEVADRKAEQKQPPQVIDRTVTREVAVTPVPTPRPPAPTPTPGLRLPPLFPDNQGDSHD